MFDPREGIAPDGTIRTGARRERIPGAFGPVLDATVDAVVTAAPDASVYVYGSVATGQARVGVSDVDLLTIGLSSDRAAEIATHQSARFATVSRGVEIASATAADFEGESDEAYGGRVFLHHYCVHLAGPDLDRATAGFAGDRRAARGFNGDIGRHIETWQRALGAADPAELGRRVARKTLLAVAGLVSVHDATWTTDRTAAAHRWGELHPDLTASLDDLLAWADASGHADDASLRRRLDDVITPVVQRFADDIGLWPDGPR